MQQITFLRQKYKFFTLIRSFKSLYFSHLVKLSQEENKLNINHETRFINDFSTYLQLYPFITQKLLLQIYINIKLSPQKMAHSQNYTQPIVKTEALDYTYTNQQYIPYGLSFLPAISPINDHSLYLILKEHLNNYQVANGLQNTSQCQCSCKKKKTRPKLFGEDSKTYAKQKKEDQKLRNMAQELALQQKEGRNSNSNLLRTFFRRLELKFYSERQEFFAIIKNLKINVTLQIFQKFVSDSQVDYKNYIRIPQVKSMFSNANPNRQCSKLLRILFAKFIRQQALNCYLTSRKIKKGSMKVNLIAIRSIQKELFFKK